MNLLVTGGAGFIGSHYVLRHVSSHPQDAIVVLDKLTYAADKHFLDPVLPHITFIEGDIADTELIKKLVKDHRIDTIVDFAAETHVDRSIADPFPFIHTNVLGVASLIEVCKAFPAVQLLHISTDEVYGDLTDTDHPKNSRDALRPSSPYAASKASGDLLVLAAARTYGIKAAISRCTNNYGPHQAQEKFIPTVIRSALAGKPVPIYAEGKNKRDWLYVTDHTDAIEMMLTVPQAFDECRIFNVSADSEQRNIDVAKKILEILGLPESLLSFVKDRPGHDWRYALDSSDTRSLGWKPAISFEEGLKKTVEWYQWDRMKSMKILLATGMYPPAIGGTATYVKHLSQQLVKKGYEVTVVTYGGMKNEQRKMNNNQVVEVDRHGNVFQRWLLYAKALRDQGRYADAVIALSSVSVGIPLILARLKKPKKILRLGGDFFWERYTDAGGMMGLKDWYERSWGFWRVVNSRHGFLTSIV